MDPFALPCHPDVLITAQDRDWRAIGVKAVDDVVRKQTRCPRCKTSWSAYLRRFAGAEGTAMTVEWVRPTPFRVSAAPLEGAGELVPVWQDAVATAGPSGEPLVEELAALQSRTTDLGPAWQRSLQLCTPVQVLAAGGAVFAEPGDLLLERREKWNAQDRRLALLWSPRLQRQVVAWHGWARLLQA